MPIKYRPEVDGLRAVAVVPVILFHAGVGAFGGGFVGVDVFFVISGYLITLILITDIEHGAFSLLTFYERRARRLLPALFFVMAVCVPFAWMWMLPGELLDFSQSLVAVSLFGSNVLFWQESGYFDAAAEAKPLLHTWSLAVEEQYYLIFPVVLLLAWRLGIRPLVCLCHGIGAEPDVERMGMAPCVGSQFLPAANASVGAFGGEPRSADGASLGRCAKAKQCAVPAGPDGYPGLLFHV